MTAAGRSERWTVVLVRPESPENIGLAVRAMKTTGFARLRIAGIDRLGPEARRTAVHASDILDEARVYPGLDEAVADLHFVLASTAKPRKIGTRRTLDEAVLLADGLPPEARIGLVFGNERTGLTAEELLRANAVFTIPQAVRQPPYNLAAAVLLTLYAIYRNKTEGGEGGSSGPFGEPPLPRREQDETIARLLSKLESRRFLHPTNRSHVSSLIHDLFGRAALTDTDRRLLLAMFEKGIEPCGPALETKTPIPRRRS